MGTIPREHSRPSRRQLLRNLLAVAAGLPWLRRRATRWNGDAAEPLAVPADAPVMRFDFDQGSLDDWQTVTGRWTIEEMSEAPSGTCTSSSSEPRRTRST